LITVLLLLAGASAALADENAAARFHGAPTYDLAVTNVKWEAGTKDYSFVTFDLAWSGSWRAKWTEPPSNNVTGKPLEIENWDAAWVFVKFLPEKDSKESIERNHWRHATLDTDASHHTMPAGATNSVGLTDDGGKGLGVFIFRNAVGQGTNNFKGVKLRWQHPASSPDKSGNYAGTSGAKFDPAKAAVRVYAIAMVYVPEGPCKVGSAGRTGITRFNDGPDMPHNRHDWHSSRTGPNAASSS
jgi:hypothetical protein